MRKISISKKILVAMLFFLLLLLSSLFYLKVAYGYEFDDWNDEQDGWGETSYEQDTNEYENENFFDGEVMGTVSISHKFLDGDILKISILARDMTMPVLGMAFHLDYDEMKVQFLKYEPGEFLEKGGDPFYLVHNNEQKSKIVFGETLRRNDNFPVGEGLVADFYFQIFKKDAMQFAFENAAVSTLDTVRQDIDKIDWQDLSLDKNGRKITEDSAENLEPAGPGEEIAANTEANTIKLPENFIIILIMGISIVGLGLWIFIDKKRKM